MIHHIFVFGVVVPTVITVLLFLGFLLCWFKLNLSERLFHKQHRHRKFRNSFSAHSVNSTQVRAHTHAYAPARKHTQHERTHACMHQLCDASSQKASNLFALSR